MAEKGRGFDRRSMLKRTALTGGALLVPGGLARGAMENGATGTDGDRPVRRLGLLLPSGKECASVARAIRAGVLDATTTTSCRVVTVEQKRTVRQEIEELFYEENLDAVICFANTNCAADLAEVANAARRPVYLVDSGVNPIDHRAYSPYLRVATLDLFEKNREIGRVAAQRGKRRGIALISVSEAGYQTPDAIRQGFEQEGGAIERYIVVDRPELDAIDHDGIRAAIAEGDWPDDIREAILLGDGRKFLAALLQIDLETTGKWAQANDVQYTTYRTLAENAQVRELIAGEVERVNARFARVENIRKFEILKKELDHDDGELTATMKVRRKAIEDKFAGEIETIYGSAA